MPVHNHFGQRFVVSYNAFLQRSKYIAAHHHFKFSSIHLFFPISMVEITATPHHPDIASSSMASCSASTLTPYVHYDIFVNHFEDETRDFAIALCNCLIHRGLHVFLDEMDFSDKEEFQSRTEDAISLASLQIAIFSPNYFQWKWSMDTLVKMTKLEALILPVFYKVEPFHLRFTSKYDKGPYAQSLHAHEEKGRYDSQIIEAWRDADPDLNKNAIDYRDNHKYKDAITINEGMQRK